MKVKATKLGYFGGRRVKVGEVFDCPQSSFSKNWMEKVSKQTKKEEKVEEKVEEKATDVLHADTYSEITKLN